MIFGLSGELDNLHEKVGWVGKVVMGFFNMSHPDDMSYLRFVYNRGVT